MPRDHPKEGGGEQRTESRNALTLQATVNNLVGLYCNLGSFYTLSFDKMNYPINIDARNFILGENNLLKSTKMIVWLGVTGYITTIFL